MTQTESVPQGVDLSNRKYLGSKRVLADNILDVIRDDGGLPGILLDGFSGTGVVAARALERGVRRVVAVDNLLSNTLILRGFAHRPTGSRDLSARIDELNAMGGVDGYVTMAYADTYFSRENCRIMDAIRERIEQWSAGGEITPGEHAYLVAGFLMAADRVANGVGQYDAYLKHLGSPSCRGGKHLVDGRVYGRFRIVAPVHLPRGELEVLTGDILDLAADIEADVAYLDPPYNGRQYCDCYHVLENLARWQKPPLLGKTRKFPRRELRSVFSSRRQAAEALRALMGRLQSGRVYLSYGSEGHLSPEEIVSILSELGSVTVHRFPYPVFGSGAGVARRRLVVEHLFGLRRGAGKT